MACRRPPHPSLPHPDRVPHRYGFTLVEMLVVITIIGILIALLIPTVNVVMKSGRSAAMAIELQDLGKAFDAYKAKFGDYPPDFTSVVAFNQHVEKAFNRGHPTAKLWLARTTTPDGRSLAHLDPAEALVLWLAMVRTNVRDPMGHLETAAKVGELHSFFKFDETRFTAPLFPDNPTGAPLVVGQGPDLDGDWWPEYVPQHAPQAPYVYFDGRIVAGAYAYATAVYPRPATAAPKQPLGNVRPYRSNTAVVPARDGSKTVPYKQPAVTDNLTTWMKPGQFQILCAGLDNDFGVDITTSNPAIPIFKQFPNPANYSATGPEEDNLADFSNGKTIVDSVP